jgi:NAD(P)-dependent dehydrogenase (short-subunit alcohol dehydrogenase family)
VASTHLAEHLTNTAFTIAGGSLTRSSLAGEVVIVTGAGGGIGFEAARALLWLGASVVIAELDVPLAAGALPKLRDEFGPERVMEVRTDVSDERAVRALVDAATSRFGRVDAVINNATFSPAGAAVVELPLEAWDRSYAVNLRGPVLLARACLPGMIARHHGAFVCVSSTGGPYLAAYETLKSAQVALANSLDAELEGTGVIALTIGPGLVPTRTATEAIERLAPRLGMTPAEFWIKNAGAVVSVEAAGAGFAAAVAMAARYSGQEISSTQALADAGIQLAARSESRSISGTAMESMRVVRGTLERQASEWKQRSFFERQWMLRDFKQRVGMPVERCIEMLATVESLGDLNVLVKLARYYDHLGELARGYVKDTKQREEQMAITAGWRREVEDLIRDAGGEVK